MLKNLLIFNNLLLIIQCQVFWYQPEQIHLSYGSNVYEMVVTWSTFNATDESKVEYGIGGLILEAKGTLKLFVDGGEAKHSQYIHTVTLENLTPGSRYGTILIKQLKRELGCASSGCLLGVAMSLLLFFTVFFLAFSLSLR